MSHYKSSSIVMASKGLVRKHKSRTKAKESDTTISQHGYTERNRNLKELGFDSYWHYLKSDMRGLIRIETFKAKGRECVSCQQDATQIHHASYDMKTLVGADLTHLHPVCRTCHQNAEMDDGLKTHKRKANHRLGVSGDERLEKREVRKRKRQESAQKQLDRLAPSLRSTIKKQFGRGSSGLSMRQLAKKHNLPRNTVRMILGWKVR